MGGKNRLRDACEYALLNGGKRFRPILVLMIGESLGKGVSVMPSALSVEFFHTASLIADDLPCMDDDQERRKRPSLHIAFGEDIAILTSYALIAEGYGGIYRNAQNRPHLAIPCLEAATRCAGIKGATNGQFLDLYPPDASFETAQKIIYQKTVTLFEVSFIYGWLFGGGEMNRLEEVKRCAYHLGMAFQIADDLLDETADVSTNIAKVLGTDAALQFFEGQIRDFSLCLKNLGLWNGLFQTVVSWLEEYSKSERT
ncbi:MAG: hypothetical protein A3D96_05805 [Chlamydiae bacterium RIFCSPHIGHO2_12_FULL_44_59]|nr:MAG: hypothetical protein A2796_03635 [Chlamydiae bacterium RIFCSPHIGHO2_01_FULL_44_39]OGN61145.1 MAG: hypothetical protein A3D96_05805 [Chlamydiae bacterium RIFCSPHIGHO2_12_FULL_44_59]OGN65615.1 MAG: hypothetical protein A2978_06610 [Chlamydiae bacterium RIFCSPLOWO2_01_FULL_44_52]OGN68092.1 MAG: hypothetical protein A3I67_05280 [Chlamydiae bacterium RIFCSPLOWO2_02_FULL_45_22]OGN68981.1 MAG: hypothetical protein A3F79_01905 [Chlamydiae bacterium RIFCSPLOWO2_12_FULL_45_20]